MEGIEAWVQETFAPIVMTCSTVEAERVAQKNRLSVSDLLNGFSILRHADTPMRSVNHSYMLADVHFRFLSAPSLRSLPLAASALPLNAVLSRHPPPVTSGVIDLELPRVRAVDDVPPFLDAINAADNAEPLPWYREFKRVLLDTFRCEDLSLLTHPTVMLLVVSSTESNPRHSFEQLASAQQLPQAFQQGLYDPNIPKYSLVLHDVGETTGTSIDPDAILHNLGVSPTSGAVLRINSRPSHAATADNAFVWSTHPYVRPSMFPDLADGRSSVKHEPNTVADHVGGLQSDDDLARLQTFVHEFGVQFVLPTLEARIFQLNEVVSAMKKGVKNVFKSWLRKPKDLSSRSQQGITGGGGNGGNVGGGGSGGGHVTYRIDSIEAQTRLLADTAFMVRDYELALQMYRLVRDDYKSDKSVYHCANANEMIALCLVLTKGSPVQIANALDAASVSYYKTPSPLTSRFAVRTAVLAGEIYNALSHAKLFTDYMDNASSALIRGSTLEQGICSAVLMERAAMCDLQARQPKFRKFGFRMVMAGHVYESLGHSSHSARCYSLARAVYDNSGWFQVEDHINFTLAQQSHRLSDSMASINLFLKLIGTGRNSASQQESLLYEFGMIVKEFLSNGVDSGTNVNSNSRSNSGPVSITTVPSSSSKMLLVRDLCMPDLDDSSTVVFAPANALGINREIDGNNTDADAWKVLDNIMVTQDQLHRHVMKQNKNNGNSDGRRYTGNVWLTPSHALSTVPYRGRKSLQQKKPEQYALGEKIYVEFEMKNALSCAVDVADIHLFGEYRPRDGSLAAFQVPESNDPTADRIAVEHVNLQLLPVSEERVRLAVCPQIPGTLRIKGIRWSICGGDVHGEHAFDIPGPLLQDTRANKEARARAPNTTLIADVVGAMPWLGVEVQVHSKGVGTDSIANGNGDAFVGEMLRLDVSLVNGGSAPLGGIQLGCSDLMLCLAEEQGTHNSAIPGTTGVSKYIGASGQVMDLSHIELQPGQSHHLTLWARGGIVGKQQARLVFKYKRVLSEEEKANNQTSNGSPEDERLALALTRSVRVKLELNLLPCVEVAYSIEPSYGTSGEYVLGLTVANRRRREDANGSHPEDATTALAVTLEQLTCVSKTWRLERFPRPSPNLRKLDNDTLNESGIITQGAARDAWYLGERERSTSYFRVVPRESPSSAHVDNKAGDNWYSSIDMRSNKDQVNLIDATVLEQMLCLDHALDIVQSAPTAANSAGEAGNRGSGGERGGGGMRSIQSVRRENKATPKDPAKGVSDSTIVSGDGTCTARDEPQPTSREALLHSLDVDAHLIITWSTPKANGGLPLHHHQKQLGQANESAISPHLVLGQSNLTSLRVRSPLQPNACPLTITLEYPDSITMNGASSVVPSSVGLSVVEVDIVMTIRNDSTLTSRPIDFTLDMLHPDEAKPVPVIASKQSSHGNSALAVTPHFFWTGLTKKSVTHFQPDATVTVKLRACFMRPGIYDLNRFRFVVSPSSSGGGSDDAATPPATAAAFVFPVEYLLHVRPAPNDQPGNEELN